MTVTLDALIQEAKSASDDVLLQLETAARKAAELEELGDALLTHFVDTCRRSGRTWAEIGAHLGVTRQAAQKRFVDAIGDGVTYERFTLRARQALDRSREIAAGMNHSYVGTEHQLLALFDVGGVAVQAMTDLGVTRDAAATEVTELAGPGTEPTGPPESLPFTPRARVVLEQALNVAVELAHNYIGTEHLLLALYRGQGGIGLQVLEKLGASRDAAKDKVLALLEGFKPA